MCLLVNVGVWLDGIVGVLVVLMCVVIFAFVSILIACVASGAEGAGVRWYLGDGCYNSKSESLFHVLWLLYLLIVQATI